MKVTMTLPGTFLSRCVVTVLERDLSGGLTYEGPGDASSSGSPEARAASSARSPGRAMTSTTTDPELYDANASSYLHDRRYPTRRG
jgi:hypothetical protein